MNWQTHGIAGCILGGLVMAWQFVSIGAGLTAAFVPVATLLQLVVLLAALHRTRGEQGYLQQLGSGTWLSAVASVFVVVGCVLALTVVFPDALDGEPVAPQALAGAIGTMVTGVVVSALAAIGWRS